MVKPFSPLELTARVKAHMHIHSTLKEEGKEKVICAGPLRIYPESYRAYKGEQPLELKGRGFQLLLFFVQNPNIVFSREGSLIGSGVTKLWETCRLLRCM